VPVVVDTFNSSGFDLQKSWTEHLSGAGKIVLETHLRCKHIESVCNLKNMTNAKMMSDESFACKTDLLLRHQ
jgi:hypothetical protein